jgi:hypothetical protein
MRVFQFIIAVVFLLATAMPAFADKTVTLGSGKSIEITGAGPIHFSQGDPALMLAYKTAIPLSDMASLRKEVSEIWDHFVIDAEHAGYQHAIISANGPEESAAFGLIKHKQMYNFSFEKKDGSWRMAEAKGQEPIKLDENIVREFFDRVDWVYEHNEMNTFLLYLANNYSATDTEGTAAPQTADRMRLAAITHQVLAATKNFQYQRKILKIKIADNGTSAQVESQETEQGNFNGQDKKEVDQTTDFIEVQGNAIVFTKTITISEDQSKKADIAKDGKK